MAAWAGFSEEELQRLQQSGDLINQAVPVTLGRGRRPAPTNRSRQQLQRERALQLTAKQKEGSQSLSPDQLLTKPPDPPVVSHPAPVKSQDESKPESQNEAEPVDRDSPVASVPPAVFKELDRQEVELREKNRLQQLQWEQRIMEEKNKQRKALLTKTIAEKSKQTQAEAVKLKKIQRELQALDDSVSNDIGVLRKLIEQSSMDYSLAWKRFEKAEAEYVAAKMDLHKKTEVKEQLTEHLCAIIQQNELRKARKLEELMHQLELNADEVPSPEETNLEDKERQGNSQHVTENGPAADMERHIDVDDSSLSKDCSITEPKISQDNQESKSTDVSADGLS
ncbi:RAB6-interacting golgin [Pimephales promelas]|uniref:RAB6-interacting golgin n=1 Tax=Pimephales promelas TaxID=90988 RepID=UPI001955A45C|nr:RAB6-interacting golgin [Pimephales promelas]KAG1963709.1 RAB6-interacting golgin [Pimephales promelas]